MDLTYKTKIRNEQVKEVAILFDRNGSTLAFLTPGQELCVESWNPESMYSRWTAITFVEGGEIKLEENPTWPKPEGKWLLTAINVEGQSCERRIIGGLETILPRGIPRLCALEADDPMAIYCRMEIQELRERGEHSLHSGYSAFSWKLKDVFTDRTEAELETLAAEMKALLELEVIEHVL